MAKQTARKSWSLGPLRFWHSPGMVGASWKDGPEVVFGRRAGWRPIDYEIAALKGRKPIIRGACSGVVYGVGDTPERMTMFTYRKGCTPEQENLLRRVAESASGRCFAIVSQDD